MNILITGANGMLAQEVKKRLSNHDLTLTDAAELDITDEQTVLDKVSELKPDFIINCAAFTAVDKAETAGEIVEKVNADGPGNLAKAAAKTGASLIHISTDYVFGGNKPIEEDYSEDDEKNPNTAYGITKLHGEQQIEAATDKFYIFRTAWLYGLGGHNFVHTMLELGRTHDKLSVVDDQHGSPTYAVDLAEVIGQTVDRAETENPVPFGVYNCTDEGYTTWSDFTKEIFRQANETHNAGINCEVIPVTTEAYVEMMGVVQAPRPKNSQMSKAKLTAAGIKMPEWKDSLAKYLAEEFEN